MNLLPNPHTFSTQAWARNAALFATIRDMPFNRELLDGHLDLACFQHYVLQDAKYLIGFGQALALAAVKSDHPALIEQFSRAATEATVVERALHADYFRRFGIAAETVVTTPTTPVCHHYVCYLLASGFKEPLPVHAAALLPCFWVYREIGRHIYASAAPDNPYRAWIDTYAGEDFSAAVDAMIDTIDALAEAAGPPMVAHMQAAFTRAMQLEWMFWDSAYRLDRWPV